MAYVKGKYTKEELATARKILLDLSDVYFEPTRPHNDRSQLINNVVYWLDESATTLTKKGSE